LSLATNSTDNDAGAFGNAIAFPRQRSVELDAVTGSDHSGIDFDLFIAE
jgi:hypothetical protein